uniref:Putative serpin n=1 Tax=Gnathostoma spinigerum TaxID=75299 RepID=A0A6G7H9W9_9BILA|nr:putative serpin [Gnathostoma spinigerum]
MSTSIAVSQADFALKLLREAEKSEGQPSATVISPFSISTALAMVYAGADGKTKEQLNNLLAKDADENELHQYFSKLIEDVNKKSEGYVLSSANRLYLHNRFSLLQGFIERINSDYGGSLREMDFTQKAAVVQEINNWVEEQTRSKITEIVTEDIISTDSRLMLINAVYFKGDWNMKFEQKLTRKEAFHVSDGIEKEVDMMRMGGRKLCYTEDNELQLLGMPYKNKEVYMYVFLPKAKNGLLEMEKNLTGERMLELIDECEEIEVMVQIPRFKVENRLELVETLKKLGIEDAFDTCADFSRMSAVPLNISDVIHKAFIEVNEEGSEAAAATAVHMVNRCAVIAPRPIRFIADHPFVFAIVKDKTFLFIATYS